MEEIRVILICGKAHSGKSTVGNILKEKLEKKYKVCNIEIMRTLKGYLKDYFNWDGKEETKPRQLLQQMGTELIREKMNMSLFHIDRLTMDIKVLANFFNIFIVDDIRYPIEIEELNKRFKTITIKVNKENYISGLTKDEEKHKSEIALDNYNNYDYVINNSNKEQLEKVIDEIIMEVNL